MLNKIVDISELKQIRKIFQDNDQKVVLCHGCFDLLHIGHLYHFEESKKLGDKLVVSITSDKYINKGANRPRFSQYERSFFLSHIDIIDYVVISDSETALPILSKLKPTIYSKGIDYLNSDRVSNPKLFKEIDFCKQNNIIINFTTTKKLSSTALLNQYFGKDFENEKYTQ